MREFLVPLSYCLLGFLGIYVIFELFDSFNRLMEGHPTLLDTVGFFAGYVSPYLEWLIPAALMLGTLYTMWNFCRHSEITAMRASGIGFSVIVRPILVVAAVFALAVACINEFYAPWASEKARKFRENRFVHKPQDDVENIAFYNIEARRIWRVDRFNPDHPNVLEGVHISFDREDRSRSCDITCPRAEFLDGMWWLINPETHHYDTMNNAVRSPTPELDALTLRSCPRFDETPYDFVLMNKAREFYSVRDMVHYLRRHPNLTKGERNDRVYDINAKLAAPFSCLIITLFAIPAGVATSRQSVSRGVIGALGMFFGFYALTIGCMILAKNGLLPAVPAAWCANLVFLAIGLVLFRKQR
ncbi:MAG: LptF/LptG family permease [Kiritimatiellae bacterium]|nr:LptF/LptG family permease [Kiritimatiellia bacterium]